MTIEKQWSPATIHGLIDSQIPHIAFSLSQIYGRQCLVITDQEMQAKKIYEDLKFFMGDRACFFPAAETVFYHIDAHSHQLLEERMKTLNKIANEEQCIVVASVESIMSRLMPKELFRERAQVIRYGESVSMEKLLWVFTQLGYERVTRVEAKGQFSIRGGIVDFYPVVTDMPYRIEFFDEEVDSIRTFDLENQLSVEKVKEVSITPIQEILLNEHNRERGIQKLKLALQGTMKKLKGDRSRKLAEKIGEVVEQLESGSLPKGIENYIDFIFEETYLLTDYLQRNAFIFVDEPSRIKEKAQNKHKEFQETFKALLEKGEVLPEQGMIVADYEEILRSIEKKQSFVLSSLPKDNPDFQPKTIINFSTRMTQTFHGKIDLLAEEVKNLKIRGYKTILLCGTEDRRKRLLESLIELGIEGVRSGIGEEVLQPGQIIILAGSLTKGFEYYSDRFITITDNEIFGVSKKKKQTAKRKDARPIKSFMDLSIGDYVVHENHGIGKYVGIEQLKVQGAKKDYLKMKYGDGDLLYVPIEQMDLVQKYIGADDGTPKLNKLGGIEWKKTKARVKGAIEDMARDLIALYAVRKTLVGYAFAKDTPWQVQFEDMFPFEETQDQLRCIREVKDDMEKPAPMDRLLCGDVGYGKTEIAIRAAFKCVMEGKQVAFLVPTTILAQQHYNTFVQRFSQFPVSVEMLSRFRTEAQQEHIIESLRVGNIDIVIGTHRILSQDVQFKDIGLLIIDEEQRFGVKHKEALKQIRKNVDVLTLTATPIPRTLHMSLIGLRDMSVIEEPPEERYPVQTYVLEYQEEMIRDAILREISRGGQVYFVFNRVKGIQQMAGKLRKMLPEIKLAVAHGQMSERELENVMIDFLAGEHDVLLCTTIIETGLDIANVNTIIIYDADKMGLSQLYQLRGRVGRSDRMAYSYLTYQKDKVLTEVAEKRLKAIKEFTEFGSGFKIAMRDLEIRGAGNLLGAEQHGHMAAIGYDLYCKLLEDTIHEMKGDEILKPVDTTIEINVNAFIPENYIENENYKLEVYKKIASIRDQQDVYDIEEELEDRFGTIPEAVRNLILIAYIKTLAQCCGVIQVSESETFVKLQFDEAHRVKPEMVAKILDQFGNRIHLHAGISPSIQLKYEDFSLRLKEIQGFLEKISGFHKK
ncbi:transcription-repair coupling factor [Geosporobacter ferrireducens]|uniref:Transcription-repair-coupling factor n=2 Tax=Geosporobacter ferrireducens TaxID=1424294 RepID=A0A1D8GQP1_9FIRM|nr:transcription-repair coupling factor [Geosporobacter ferrireducens]MTI58284.1 transcription-repair coupling factor [Geosporobacter ferrireducens]